MPIRAFLHGKSFDHETISAMSAALEEACRALKVGPGSPTRAMVAQVIILLAEEGRIDRAQLAAAAVKEMGGAHRKLARNDCPD